MPSYGGYEFQSLQMDLLAFLVAIWESLDGDQFCFYMSNSDQFWKRFFEGI
jgi:hypothetical protein